jgi:predicted nucleic acid-binding protein
MGIIFLLFTFYFLLFNRVLCLDTSVWIPYLVPEVYQPQSRKLLAEALSLSIPLVAPAFAWAEVGSVPILLG